MDKRNAVLVKSRYSVHNTPYNTSRYDHEKHSGCGPEECESAMENFDAQTTKSADLTVKMIIKLHQISA